MKKWVIPVSWTMLGTVCIEADTLAEAIEEAWCDDIPLPNDGEYGTGSWMVDGDEEYIRVCHNNGQRDAINEEVKNND